MSNKIRVTFQSTTQKMKFSKHVLANEILKELYSVQKGGGSFRKNINRGSKKLDSQVETLLEKSMLRIYENNLEV